MVKYTIYSHFWINSLLKSRDADSSHILEEHLSLAFYLGPVQLIPDTMPVLKSNCF